MFPERDEMMRQQALAQHGGPAFLRRARAVQAAATILIERCRVRREGLLSMVRVRLGLLGALAGEWCALAPYVADGEQIATLRRLEEDLAPKLRIALTPTSVARKLERALRDVQQSIARFNRKWDSYLRNVDLDDVNRLRDAYNRFYVLEKECATQSLSAAQQHFEPLLPLTLQMLRERFPNLPIPRARRENASSS